jgi:hypothetical protein
MSTSSTVHFAANWKNRESIVTGLCSKFALRGPANVETTTNKDEVTCTRCAKSLGITPAAKAVSSTRGTCQCCFGAYETRQQKNGGWAMVLHGYKRPGHGYIVGECRGNGYAPFEVSCEQTKVWLAELKTISAAQAQYLNDVKAGLVEKFLFSARTGERTGGRFTRQDVTKFVEVVKGDEEKQNPFLPNTYWEKIPSYATLQKRIAADTEQTISAIDADIKFLAAKIASWAPVTFPLAK